MKPRLKHVAELAGVSQATVSRVLNDKPGVAEETRRGVLQALGQMGYEPVSTAQTRRRGLVGLIVPELDNPVFPRFAQEIESLLAREGLTTVLCTSTPSGMREADYLDILLDHAVSGIVLISGEHADLLADHGRYRDLAARNVPTVLVNGTVPDLGVSTVSVNHELAAHKAVAHLAALGHERIGLAIGPRRYVPTGELRGGFTSAMTEAGLVPSEDLTSETLYSIEGGHAAALNLLAKDVTGIVCASDRMALGAMRAVTESGLNVPEEVSVIGFDDAGPNAFFHPPLTSVQQPFESMCRAIVHLLRLAADDPTEEPADLRFVPELVVRASTSASPHRDRVGPVAGGK